MRKIFRAFTQQAYPGLYQITTRYGSYENCGPSELYFRSREMSCLYFGSISMSIFPPPPLRKNDTVFFSFSWYFIRYCSPHNRLPLFFRFCTFYPFTFLFPNLSAVLPIPHFSSPPPLRQKMSADFYSNNMFPSLFFERDSLPTWTSIHSTGFWGQPSKPHGLNQSIHLDLST